MPSHRRAASAHEARRRVISALLVALVAASGLLVASLVGPPAAVGLGPLPACRYDDILTAPRGYDDWPVTLVDTILRVSKSYVPPDLVSVSNAGIGGTGKIRTVAIDDLTAMTAAAKAAGNPIAVESAYRSYTTQQSTFQYWVNQLGYKQALLASARPGHSEHQLGLAIDFKSGAGGAPWSGSDWGQSPAGSWMRQHAWAFGWVLSYPKGKTSKTCYEYEPWHYRYVGRDLAAKIHASGVTPREYLWAHFTTAIVPTVAPTPAPTKRPASTPRPSLVPSPAASSAEEPSASPHVTASASPSATPRATVSASSASPAPDPGATAVPGSAPAAAAGSDASGPLAAVIGAGLAAMALLTLVRSRRRSRSGPFAT